MILLRFGFRNFFVVVDGVVLYIKCICLYLCGEKKMQVRICREKSTGQVYAMKKLKKLEMLRRGQVDMCYIRLSYEELTLMKNYEFHLNCVEITCFFALRH